MIKKYFVSYTTNKLELPKLGWNVWEVKKKKHKIGNPYSYIILDIIIGGKKRSDARVMSSSDIGSFVDNKREVFKRVFNELDR